ncbi:MAG: ABC transporter substrate-binding protein [Bryobacteraceae bacterium]
MLAFLGSAALNIFASAAIGGALWAQPQPSIGIPGGRLVVVQRSEPKTLNPVFAVDEPSRSVAGLLGAPLVRIHPATHVTEGVLAESWKVSDDGREIAVSLRPGLRFSDGAPLTVEDVLFTFSIHLDPKIASPQRELLIVAGQPVKVARTGERTLRFTVREPYAPGERMLAGLAILPKHLLDAGYLAGTLSSAWTLHTPAREIAGAGPFRLKAYQPGQRVVLERNPHYWKRDPAGSQLPYLDELEFAFASGEDAQIARFAAGEADLISGFGGGGYRALEGTRDRPQFQLVDAGASLDYTFLLFNLNPAAVPPAGPRAWFEIPAFRLAVSGAIDREAIVRLVYRGRGSAIWSPVTPARKRWFDESLPRPPRSVSRARELLRAAGFGWNATGQLLDAKGTPVTFTVLANSGNTAYTQTAAIIQEDLKPLGMTVQVAPLEFRSLVDRVVNRRDFDAAIMALRPGDVDPAADMNALVSQGRTRLWNLSGKSARDWEAGIDRLMRQQMSTTDQSLRRRLFHEVQRLLADHQPIVCLASPNLLYAARAGLGNLRPGVIGDLVLWNADELFWMSREPAGRR